ncbi:MAG: SRPBCC family protein [Opitutaceae bacterium]|nr:SRPBCC family protein [Verrucomicrobiales bacterium]
MLIKILTGIAVLLIILLIVIATRPGEFKVARSATINTSPALVFAQVNELRKWEAWNPWGKLDPNMKLTYSGAASGVGASYAWVGNNEVGEGRATITEIRADELVQLKLEFFKPMAGVSTATFTLRPHGGHTEVTWAMDGKNNFIAKAMCLVMSMDKMIGNQFEKGLADLKLVAEAAAKK